MRWINAGFEGFGSSAWVGRLGMDRLCHAIGSGRLRYWTWLGIPMKKPSFPKEWFRKDLQLIFLEQSLFLI